MEILFTILVVGLAYLFGSIPFGMIIGKYIARVDVTKEGSGNIGATNVLRTCGKKWGAITLILDILKGIAAVAMAIGVSHQAALLAGLAVVVGHMFPVWLQFKGGKGVATSLAVYAVIYWPVALFYGAVWLTTFSITKYSSLSSILGAALSPVIAIAFAPSGVGALSLVINGLIIYRHKDNIMRLLRGKEGKMSTNGASS